MTIRIGGTEQVFNDFRILVNHRLHNQAMYMYKTDVYPTAHNFKRSGWVSCIAIVYLFVGCGSEISLLNTVYINCATASWLGVCLCHSSTRSLRYLPTMSRGTKAPVNKTTFPSMFHLTFPCLIYSSTTSQLLIKCSSEPQKVHPVWGFAGGHGPPLVGCMWLCVAFCATIALMKESVSRLRIAAKSSVLTLGAATVIEVIAIIVVLGHVESVDDVPCRTYSVASWMASSV